ncbi:MAG TPA: nuclear transport factor 2 family protein [Ktedonobacteraceae bacterium]|nr:nuclear transport factor 2 family protein [Ktedonobacteraceae bacterium]
MQDIETVTAFLAALNANDFHTVETYLGDTFVLHGNLSKQPGKYVFLGLFMGLAYGFPDYSFQTEHVSVVDSTIEATVQFMGTHTGLLNLSLAVPGLPAIPPTDKKLSRPAYCLAFTLRHEKIVTIDLDHGQDSIFLWILKQLNIALSSAS